jgi:hypothetical protein
MEIMDYLKFKSEYLNSDIECAYDCIGHRGKRDWHHPCSQYPLVVMPLCEAHHSLMTLGRKVRYPFEMGINKTLEEMHLELKELELRMVLKSGLTEQDIDKH